MNRRIELLRQTFLKKKTGGPLKDWLLNCLGPTSDILARARIEAVIEEEPFVKVKLKNIPGYLYYPQGLPMPPLYQTLAEQLYSWQWHYYQVPETTVTPDDVVLDCGCAEGSFSFLVQPTARHIYAIEPLPEYLAGLRKTFSDSHNVTIVPQALGDRKERAYLKSRGIASSITHEPTDISVTIDTLDHICQQQDFAPTYLKADLEGYEMTMLAGAVHVIRTHRPKVAITTYHREQHVQEIADFLRSLVPTYQIRVKGIEERKGAPVMLHAWVPSP